MNIFRRIFFAAVLAGAVAGLAHAAIQQWRVVPLILEAETYENADGGHSHETVEMTTETAAHDESVEHSHGEASTEMADAHEDDAEDWAPQDGFERTLYTILATTLAGIGFALVLGAVAVVANVPLTSQTGFLWGLAGFLSFSMAPAFGLAPELPGMAAADLGARQIWWWGTALATGAGLLVMAKKPEPFAIALGVALILAPHILGAPAPADHHSDVPAYLATGFAAAALTSAMVYWLISGFLLGWFYDRLNKQEAA